MSKHTTTMTQKKDRPSQPKKNTPASGNEVAKGKQRENVARVRDWVMQEHRRALDYLADK